MSHPAGFFSYVRFNDENEEGRLSELRDKLEAEVSMLLGEKFELFQDSKGVGMGENWQKRLDEGLAESTLFIPIVTPAYLKRTACREELEKFLAKEQELERDDLILPLIYVETPALADEARRNQDPLAIALHTHQYRDWSDLRFEPWDKSKFMRLTAIAKEIVKALERGPAHPKKTTKAQSRLKKDDTNASAEIEGLLQSETAIPAPQAQEGRGKSKRIEPITLVVDPMPGRGDFTSIGAAIAAAVGGERILVRPHIYSEAVRLDKSVELIGDGKRDEIIIEASGAHIISFQTSFGRVANFTIRQTGGGDWYCVDIPQGQLVLEDCDITSQSLSSVAVHDGANPILRRNTIHDGNQSGIFFYENGRGTVEDNDILLNSRAGVQISTGADPVLRRNRIHDNKGGGVLLSESAKGTLEDNDIFGNAFAGVEIRLDADPVLRRNRIHDGKVSGVLVVKTGRGTLEDNDIFGNLASGVEIRDGGLPTLRRNRINRNDRAIWIQEKGKGTFQGNDLRNNKQGPWRIDDDTPDLVRENNVES